MGDSGKAADRGTWLNTCVALFMQISIIANDETEISYVVRRRLFEDLGSDKVRKNVAKAFADWCFERRAQLPSEWTSVDTATTEAKSREFPPDMPQRQK